jgi:hypothetical protein
MSFDQIPYKFIKELNSLEDCFTKQWVINFYNHIKKLNLLWVSPHITFDEDNNSCLEWWYNNRKVTIYLELENKQITVLFYEEPDQDAILKLDKITDLVLPLSNLQEVTRIWCWFTCKYRI